MDVKTIPTFQCVPITQVQIVKYAGASGDFNRIHIDEVFASKSSLNGVIAHGMLSMGIVGSYLDKIAGADYDVKNFKVRFQMMVRPEDEIFVQIIEIEQLECDIQLQFVVKNQDDEVIVSGNAILKAVNTDEKVR